MGNYQNNKTDNKLNNQFFHFLPIAYYFLFSSLFLPEHLKFSATYFYVLSIHVYSGIYGIWYRIKTLVGMLFSGLVLWLCFQSLLMWTLWNSSGGSSGRVSATHLGESWIDNLAPGFSSLTFVGVWAMKQCMGHFHSLSVTTLRFLKQKKQLILNVNLWFS